MDEAHGVLVTGGAGFVGATLVRHLVASGHRVRVFDNYSTGDESHLSGVDVEIAGGDIRDIESLGAALADVRSVVHLAAAGSVIGSVEDPRHGITRTSTTYPRRLSWHWRRTSLEAQSCMSPRAWRPR